VRVSVTWWLRVLRMLGGELALVFVSTLMSTLGGVGEWWWALGKQAVEGDSEVGPG
jgi:hypothetical protein